MPKVTGPLFSLKATGQFAKSLIFKRGGIVVNYFKPRNPNSAAQQAQRQAFKELYVPGLTQEQADLLYAAIVHLHDDRYSQLGHDHNDLYSLLTHLHDDRYSQLGHDHAGVYAAAAHQHTSRVPVFFHALSATIVGSGTVWLIPGVSGFLSSVNGTMIPMACTVKNLYVRLNGTQPAGGSIVATLQKSTVDSALAVTIPAGSGAGGYSNLINSVTFAGGETLGIKIKNNAGTTSAPITSVAVELQPATQ